MKHALASDACWVLPHLAAWSTSTSVAVTNAIKELIPPTQFRAMAQHNCGIFTVKGKTYVKNLPEDADGTSLRVGGVVDIGEHPTCSLKHFITRSGHENNGPGKNVFEYNCPSQILMNAAGRALAGWPNAQLRCKPAHCDFLFDEGVQVRFAYYLRQYILINAVL